VLVLVHRDAARAKLVANGPGGATLDKRTRLAVEWLLASNEPAIRVMARRDLLDEPAGNDAEHILDGPKVRALFAGQQPDGGFGVHPYKKWTGAHWRLVSLTELEIPAGEPRAHRMAETVLDWLTSDRHRSAIPTINGRVRRCASQEGNAIAACSRLGLADDPRVALLAQSLVAWQWPDGGWNCDRRPEANHSSMHETLIPTWGLHQYAEATGDTAAGAAARRAADFLLEHRLFRSHRTGSIVDPRWLDLRYPPYWHYNVLHGLLVLSQMGRAPDPRASEALDIIEERRLADGRWRPNGYWWRPRDKSGSGIDVADWGRGGPNEMITLNALRVLRAADRLD
jgi:hypothetical protein